MSTFAHLTVRRSLLVAVAALALVGCGSKYKTFCEDQAQCIGGNDADIDACVAEAEGQKDVASAYDCSDPWDKLADCYENKGTCKNKQYTADCGSEQAALQSCEKAASSRNK